MTQQEQRYRPIFVRYPENEHQAMAQAVPRYRGILLKSALARLHARVFLVDHINATMTTHDAAVFIARLGGAK